MKYEIAINQKAWQDLIPTGSLTHAAILDVFFSLCTSSGLIRKNGYTWVTLKMIQKELPLFRLSTSGVSRAVTFLEKNNVIESFTDNGNNKYYKLTDIAYSLRGIETTGEEEK